MFESTGKHAAVGLPYIASNTKTQRAQYARFRLIKAAHSIKSIQFSNGQIDFS